MGQNIVLTGMVLKVMPIGDYDKRITVLTKERGKITAFAKGARRPNSQLLAATNPFSFGEFEFFEGRSTYNLAKTEISNYFRGLSKDPEAVCYGFYFLEFADYYAQENHVDKELLKLLYQTLRALEKSSIDNRLVRRVFELKAIQIEGEYPNLFTCQKCGGNEGKFNFSVKHGGLLCQNCVTGTDGFSLDDSVLYTMQYILSSEIRKLYTFTVSAEVLSLLEYSVERYLTYYLPHKFKSLDILKSIVG